MNQFKTRIEKLEQNMLQRKTQHISVNDKSLQILDQSSSPYVPVNTASKFHLSDKFIRLLMGPYGSGKSTACCAEIVLRACSMPKCSDGIRRSRCVVVRNTSGELETTTLKTWRDWFDGLGTITSRKKPVMMYEHTFNDDQGLVNLELLFLALDREEDIRKLKSLETTFAYLNEASELPFGIMQHLVSRVGRYPSRRLCTESYWHGIFMDTNPPDTDHWIYKTFEVNREDNTEIFKQPPALIKQENGSWIKNESAENLNHLGEDYYINLAKGAKEEFIKVYVLGEYGAVIGGKLVYPQYNDDLHSIKVVNNVSTNSIVLAWDFGLTPAALIMQCINGQLRVLKEFVTDRMGINEFASTIVLPYLHQNFKGQAIASVCDPSGVRAMDTDAKSCMAILDDLGLPTDPAVSNNIIQRIEAVNYFLNRMSGGNPALIISKEECPTLRKGFLGKYNYKRVQVVGDEKYREIPDKTHPYSDIHDCLQYGSLYYTIDLINSSKKLDVKDICMPSSTMWA